jgi:hypothetical protein
MTRDALKSPKLYFWTSPAQLSLGSSPRGLMTIFYSSQIWYCPNLEGQVLVFVSLSNRPSYTPRHWGSLFIESYDSDESYGGGNGTRLHVGTPVSYITTDGQSDSMSW